MKYMDTDRNVTLTPIDKKTLIIGILFFVLGIALGIYSFISIKNHDEKAKTYIESNSVVVDYNYDVNENGDELRAIIVEYEVDGRKYRKESNDYSTVYRSIGDRVLIQYNPNNPSDAIWKNDNGNIIVPIVAGLFVIAGIIVVVRYFKEK